MYDYLDTIAAAEHKRWNGKVITTSRQWLFNDNGSDQCATAHLYGVVEAIKEAGIYSVCDRAVEEMIYGIF